MSGHLFSITRQYVARRIDLHRKLSGPRARCIFATQLPLLFFIREGIWRISTYGVIDVSQLLRSWFYFTHIWPSIGTVVLYLSSEIEKVICKRKWQLLFSFLICCMKNSIVVQIHCSAEAIQVWKNIFVRNEWDFKRNILSVVLKGKSRSVHWQFIHLFAFIAVLHIEGGEGKIIFQLICDFAVPGPAWSFI